MKWKAVSQFATENNIEIYRPLMGCHRNVQIVLTEEKTHTWASNRAKDVWVSLQAIVHQRALAKVSTDALINQSEIAKSFI